VSLEVTNCRGTQEIAHACLFKGEGLSEERMELLCGCKGMLVQCLLSVWSK